MMRGLNLRRLALMSMLGILAALANAQAQDGAGIRPNNSSAPATEFRMQALRAEPGKPSLYDVRFTTVDTLDARAELVFEFPAALDVSLLEVASSTTINGGFTITREGNRVRVLRTGLGATLPPGRQVEVKLGLITSPATLAGNLEVGFSQIRASGQPAAAKKNYPIQFVPKPVF